MFTALMLLAATAGADVQPTAQTVSAQPPIVVTGERLGDPEAIRRYVRHIATPSQDQLARLHAPVCPLISGMPEPYAGRLAERIRSVARTAGLRAGGAGCTPNVNLIFTENAASFVQAARRSAPHMFLGLEPADVRRMVRRDPRVIAWHATEVRNGDGLDNGPDGSTGPGMFVPNASIINLQTRQDILASYVVIEQSAAEGKDLNQLADYAAMRMLAEVRPPEGSAAPGATILSLFDTGARAPRGMTQLDAAYLNALYRAPVNVRFPQQAATIAAIMNQETARP